MEGTHNGTAELAGSVDSIVKKLEAAMAEFLKTNTSSKIETVDGEQQYQAVINPWGDESFNIRVALENAPLIAALNSVYLPERLVAIWHRGSKTLEIIFTAFPLPSGLEDIATRSFTFNYRGNEHKCYYGPSSEELLLIAENFNALSASDSNFRNLHSFRSFRASKKPNQNNRGTILTLNPVSFFISDVAWDDDERVVEFVQHLNFYMNCYDSNSPQIWVISPKSESYTPHPQTRFPFDKFPATIVAREIDDTLLRFWDASLNGDHIRRFLYNYQILEYGAFYFLQEKTKKSISKCLAVPHAISEPDELIQQVLDLLTQNNQSDDKKLFALVEAVVTHEDIWKEISQNPQHFSSTITFDGGLTLEPLIPSATSTLGDFKQNGLQNFVARITKIRNAVAHGREYRMSKVITPTDMNFRRIGPWTSLIAIAARNTILYRHIA